MKVRASEHSEARERASVIAAGYMRKKVLPRPPWIKKESVTKIVAVSSCFSTDFADYVKYWRHNGFWLFNKPSDMDEIVALEGVNPSDFALFYYEVHERQFDEEAKEWSRFRPEPSCVTDVEQPANARLAGFDVVSFAAETSAECSPLSCNALADELPVNENCLFETFDDARLALETGRFDNSEPGPFRIFAVYLVEVEQPSA